MAPCDFPGWAMSLVDGAIPHTACFWGSGAWIDGEIVVHTSWLNNIPAEAILDWERHKHADTVSLKLLANAGQVVNFSNADLRGEYAYEPLFRPVGIEQLMGIYLPNPLTGLYDAISLYRADPAAAFGADECRAFAGVVPHLVEARRVNYLDGLNADRAHSAIPLRRHVAVADLKGVLHAAEDDFIHLARLEWPNWQGARLPEALLARLGEGGEHCFGEKTVVRWLCRNDTYRLSIRPRTPADSLSERERQIARHFAEGRSHKGIALDFEISPSTVRNHLSTIYRKLDIHGKAELTALLSQID
ncbi:MAG: hypothetical protein KGZ83_17945 [Sulfuricella sp.]|nr:hypothetical protein [Sulfuricella sp.]